MQRKRLWVVVAALVAALFSWSAGVDAKPDGARCTGGSANAASCDLDGDGIANKDDDDIDGDGVANDADPCPRDAADQCEAEEPGPDPTGGLPGLEDVPLPEDLPGLEDLPPVEPPGDVPPGGVPPVEPPPVEPPADVPPDGVPPEPPPFEVPPVEVPPVEAPTLPDVPPVV